MGLEEFLKVIKPELTLYVVLVTLSVIFFLIGKYFWKFEESLRNKNIKRLADVMDGYRRSYIEPILQKQLIEAQVALKYYQKL